MIRTLAPLAALLLAAGMLLTGNGLFNTVVPLELAGGVLDPTLTAAILSTYYAGLVAGSLRAPRVIERVGHIRAFAAFAAMVTAAALLIPLIPAGGWWIGIRLLSGFAMAGAFVTIESWLSDQVEPDRRGAVFSVYMIVNYGALTAGQFLLTQAPPSTPLPFALVALLTCLAVLPIALVRVKAPTVQTQARRGLIALYRNSPIGIVGCCAIGMTNGAFFAMAPIFAHDIGMDIDQVALFMSAAVVGGLAFQWPIGWLSDHRDRRIVLAIVSAAVTVMGGALAWMAATGGWLPLVLAALYGGFNFTLYPLCVAHAQDRAPAEERIAIAGGLLLAYGCGAAVGPMAASPLMQHIGPTGLFVFTGSAALLLCLYTSFRITRRAQPSQKGSFSAAALTSPAVTALDPQPIPTGGPTS